MYEKGLHKGSRCHMRTFYFQLSSNSSHPFQKPIILLTNFINWFNDAINSFNQFLIWMLFTQIYKRNSTMDKNNSCSYSSEGRHRRHGFLQDQLHTLFCVFQISDCVFKRNYIRGFRVFRSRSRGFKSSRNEAKGKRYIGQRIFKALIPCSLILKVLLSLTLTLQFTLVAKNSARALLIFPEGSFRRIDRVKKNHKSKQSLHPSSTSTAAEPSTNTQPIITNHGFPPNIKGITIFQLAPSSQWAGGAA
ncbi:hypothetical protein SAMN04515663_101400 [Alcanivorax sp. DSM 26293]|nr:hypothetical protein SAMN04515663_101400 [Alcanivorax sp. DSM 26293]